MKELFEKYFWATLVFSGLFAALIIFRDDQNVRNNIITAFISLIAAPAIMPKSSKETPKDSNSNL